MLKRTRSLAWKMETREQVTTGSPKRSGLSCAMVLTVSFVLAPETGLYCLRPRRDAGVSGPPGRHRHIIAKLISASGYQAHTTSPSASAPLVLTAQRRPPHPAPNARDDRETPLRRGGMAQACKDDLPDGRSEYFSYQGWT
jgi:hypothetical protein